MLSWTSDNDIPSLELEAVEDSSMAEGVAINTV